MRPPTRDGDDMKTRISALIDGELEQHEVAETLQSLRQLLAESRITLPEGLPPMAAGIFGYMGYDTVRLIENLPNVRPDVLDVPDAILMRPTVMVIFDAVRDEMTVVTPVYPRSRVTAKKAYADAIARLERVVGSLDEPLPHEAMPTERDLAAPEPSHASWPHFIFLPR